MTRPEEEEAPRPRELPRVRLHAFGETSEGVSSLKAFASDRRLANVNVDVVEGGLAAALARYASSPSPDLLIVESRLAAAELLLELDRLSEHCEPGTRVVIVGHVNDIGLYRALLAAGVEDYLVAPASPQSLVRTAERLFCGPETGPIAKVFAFIGAKGGVGSSVVAQNVAAALSLGGRETLLLDLDLSWGVAALHCDVEPGRGVAEAVRELDRLDAALLDRLAVRRDGALSVLGVGAALELSDDLSEEGVRRILDVAEAHFPFIVIDLPHRWTGWVQTALRRADEVVLTATPTLAALRNAAALLEAVRALRPNDAPPRLVLNAASGAAEIAERDVQTTLHIAPSCRLPWEPRLFADAAARGEMLAETRRGRALGKEIEALALMLAGSSPAPERKRGLLARLRRS